MTNNKIPLALGYDLSTGNASGLEEFTLDLSNVGDVCDATPTEGQTLVYSSTGKWCPSTIVTGGGGGGVYGPSVPSGTGNGGGGPGGPGPGSTATGPGTAGTANTGGGGGGWN